MLNFRYAEASDVDRYFKWANDALVRRNSLITEKIDFEDHVKWFTSKIENPDVYMYVFFDENNMPVGQVIIEKKAGWTSVGQSVSAEHRGKKYSSEMLTKSTNDFLSKFPKETFISVVKASNIASLKMAENSGFNVLFLSNQQDHYLVLKGCNQNDQYFINKAEELFNL